MRLRGCLLLLLVGYAGLARAVIYPLPTGSNNLVGVIRYTTANREDTLAEIARNNDIGYDALRLANPHVDAWLPQAGASVLLPSEYILPDTRRQGIVINLPAMRLFYYSPSGKEVQTFPIGVGREGWNTPVGSTQIVAKVRNPTWTPPASVRAEHAEAGDPLPAVVAAGPDNPLGQYALRLAWPGYLIHGTNKPFGVGMRVSHGCIRLLPQDIKVLFAQVHPGTRVQVVDQPWLWGHRDGHYYLQVFPALQPNGAAQLTKFHTWLEKTVPAGLQVSWEQAAKIYETADGVPTLVAIASPNPG